MPKPYPVPEHPTWYIYDSSKIQEYLECPRSFFYRYIMGWDSDSFNNHTYFGECWHIGMEHLILNGYSTKSVAEAARALTDHYRKKVPDIMDSSYAPKNPGNALVALTGYIVEYAGETFIPHYTEIAGTVPINDRNVLHFRMDSVLEDARGYFSREHKTGSQLSRMWLDQWALSFQCGTYNHVLYCLYDPAKVWGVEINGTIFNKTKTQFQRVPSRRTLSAMQSWFWHANEYVSRIEHDLARLRSSSKDDEVLMCFAQNPTSCTKYFGCPYHSFCMAWANPLKYSDEAPIGFHLEWWNPADHEERKPKHVFDFSKKEIDFILMGGV